jgi:UDP-glucuronate 4-epimerase
MKVLVTGCAGFVGMHTAQRLLERGDEVVGLDNLNDYYDVGLKRARLEKLQAFDGFRFERLDIADRAALREWWSRERPQRVVHLAAQAGVRHSIAHPDAFVDSNLVGFGSILEGCRRNGVEHLVFASSSSVYGANAKLPFSEHDCVDHPVSLYAATKKANELMAHVYSHLYRLPVTGLRFFTAYGPWGRPDMALFLFTQAMLAGNPIDIFNNGRMVRDFTYIDDIVQGVVRALDKPAEPDPAFDAMRPDPAASTAPYRIFNIGNNRPTPLMDYVAALEQALGFEARKNLLPMQPGDIPATFADVDALNDWVGFRPETPVAEGVRHFVQWYRAYYRV